MFAGGQGDLSYLEGNVHKNEETEKEREGGEATGSGCLGSKMESRKAENRVCPSSAWHCADHALSLSLTEGIWLFYYTS